MTDIIVWIVVAFVNTVTIYMLLDIRRMRKDRDALRRGVTFTASQVGNPKEKKIVTPSEEPIPPKVTPVPEPLPEKVPA